MGFFGGSKKQTIGYKYFLGLHMVLCHGPIDSIREIWVGEKKAWGGTLTGSDFKSALRSWEKNEKKIRDYTKLNDKYNANLPVPASYPKPVEGSPVISTGGRIRIERSKLFGGKKKEGGIEGNLDFLPGAPDQGRNDYLQSKLGSDIPAFRGVTSVVLRQMYLGTSQYIKTWKFRATRIHRSTNGEAQWYPEAAQIGDDLNPAHIIYECIVNTDWGLEYNVNDIDNASFRAAADALKAEGFGLSVLWSQSTDIKEFIQEIIQHIDASLFVDRTTGRYTLKLIRSDYNPDLLPILDDDSIVSVAKYSKPTIGELTNSVTVKFWNRELGEEDAVTMQDIALTQQQGAVVSKSIEYQACCTAELAAKLCARDLRALTTPLIECTIECSRRVAGKLNIGDPFQLKWPDFGINEVTMRVQSIDMGTRTSGAISIQCVQDAFGLGKAMYSTPPATGWSPTDEIALPVQTRYHMSAPYWDLANNLDAGDFAQLTDQTSYIETLAMQPSYATANGTYYTAPAPDEAYTAWGDIDFTPTGLLRYDVAPLDNELSFTNVSEWPDTLEPGAYIMLGEGTETECVQYLGGEAGEVVVLRGVLDTVPKAHALGTRMWIPQDDFSTDSRAHAVGSTQYIKMTTSTDGDGLDLLEVPTDAFTHTDRQWLPYPPGNYRVNGVPLPQGSITGPLELSWKHRNRLVTDRMLSFFDDTPAEGAEPDTLYYVRIWDEDGKLVVDDNTIAGTAYDYTTEEADLGKTGNGYTGIFQLVPGPPPAPVGRLNGNLTIRLSSIRNGDESWQSYQSNLTRAGYGYGYGQNYGGSAI